MRKSLSSIAPAALMTALGISAVCLFGLGPTGGPPNPNAERMRIAFEQLGRAEEELAGAQLVQDFWERESAAQEQMMAQYGPLQQNDMVVPTLYDRAKQLAYRCGYQLQDAKLRVAQLSQRCAVLRAQAAGQ